MLVRLHASMSTPRPPRSPFAFGFHLQHLLLHLHLPPPLLARALLHTARTCLLPLRARALAHCSCCAMMTGPLCTASKEGTSSSSAEVEGRSVSGMTNPLDFQPLESRGTFGPSGTFMNLIFDSTFFFAAAYSAMRRLHLVPTVPLSDQHFFQRPTVAVMYSSGPGSSFSLNREVKSSAVANYWGQT
jgi:hypothetical protein